MVPHAGICMGGPAARRVPTAPAAADAGGEVHAALVVAMAQRVLPDRIERSAVKRRPKPHPLLNVPRPGAREALK